MRALIRGVFVLLPTLVGAPSIAKPLKLTRASVLNLLEAKRPECRLARGQ